MRGLNLGQRSNENRIQSFYCRMENRVLEDGCPQASGTGECPLRQNCPAHAGLVRESANPIGVIRSL